MDMLPFTRPDIDEETIASVAEVLTLAANRISAVMG